MSKKCGKRTQTLLFADLAEKLVQMDILRSGYLVNYSHHRAEHDCIVEDTELGLLPVQVKSTNRLTKTGVYRFDIRKSPKNKTNRRYKSAAFDLVALVALDEERIAYRALPNSIPSQITLRLTDFDSYTLERAIAEIKEARREKK